MENIRERSNCVLLRLQLDTRKGWEKLAIALMYDKLFLQQYSYLVVINAGSTSVV